MELKHSTIAMDCGISAWVLIDFRRIAADLVTSRGISLRKTGEGPGADYAYNERKGEEIVKARGDHAEYAERQRKRR